MIDPGIAYHYLSSQQEWTITDLRSQLLGLQQHFGVDDPSPYGVFWRERTRAFEYLLAAAERAVRAEPGLAFLSEAVDAVNGVAAPACRAGDHQVA